MFCEPTRQVVSMSNIVHTEVITKNIDDVIHKSYESRLRDAPLYPAIKLSPFRLKLE